MPLLRIQTSHALDPDTARALAATASRAVAEALGKPERWVMVIVEDAPRSMMFAGSAERAAYCELKSIGLPRNRAGDVSRLLAGLLADTAHIAAERIYVEFSDADAGMWGWNGGTF